VTGGEPLLRQDFFEIMKYARELGFRWGMTSNGTLITPETAHQLHEAGMQTISVSVDGLQESHDWFRKSVGSYERTMQGIDALLREGGFRHIQITTVVHHKNIHELEMMYHRFSQLGVRSWRVINIEPIGRAKEQPELLLTADEYCKLFDFIAEYRTKGKMTVSYGCSHYLGPELEREVRRWYFLCNAGVYTASVMYNGDIGACLDIERRPELVQGNIRRDRLKDVWEQQFRIFREDYRKTGKCKRCKDYTFCAGDSFHTWNFDTMQPNVCMKGILW
jgi:radical SAM protein with 4Fe4S-binding SPASM domain